MKTLILALALAVAWPARAQAPLDAISRNNSAVVLGMDAREAYEAADYDKAIALYRQSLAYQDNANYRYDILLSQVHAGRCTDVLPELLQQSANAHFAAARCLAETSRWSEARSQLADDDRVRPGNYSSRVLRDAIDLGESGKLSPSQIHARMEASTLALRAERSMKKKWPPLYSSETTHRLPLDQEEGHLRCSVTDTAYRYDATVTAQLRKALSLDPASAIGHYYLACLYFAATPGREPDVRSRAISDGLKVLEQYLAIDETNEAINTLYGEWKRTTKP